MNASSESGLWALTISRGGAEVICVGRTKPVYTSELFNLGEGRKKGRRENTKGRSFAVSKLKSLRWRSSDMRHAHVPNTAWYRLNPSVRSFSYYLLTCRE